MKNNLKLVCPKCGTPHQPHSPHTMDADGFERCEIRTVMEDMGWCSPSLPQRDVPIYSVAITKHTLSTRAIPLHRSLEYPLLDQFSFVYNPPSTCWMYMPLLIISEGFTPIPI